MLTVWDIWDFRNSLVHGLGDINERARHKELNYQIKQQFQIGFDTLLLCDHRIYRQYSLNKLLDSSKETKQNWIRNLLAARLAANNDNENEEEHSPQHVQTSIENFLENVCAFI